VNTLTLFGKVVVNLYVTVVVYVTSQTSLVLL